MKSSSGCILSLLQAIADCHCRLKLHACQLAKHCDKVQTVNHAVDMPVVLSGFRLEEFVDAELVTGEAISWCLEITVTNEDILIEADVRRIHTKGQDIITSVAEHRYSNVPECSKQLRGIIEQLCNVNPLKGM